MSERLSLRTPKLDFQAGAYVGTFILLVVIIILVSGGIRVLAKLGDAGIGEAHGVVDVMSHGFMEGGIVLGQAIEGGAELE